MSLSLIAATALKLGPLAIRGIASLLGGNETADKVANVVESAHQALTSAEEKSAVVHEALSQMTPEQQIELLALQSKMEEALAEQARIQAQDRQSEHTTTQQTVQSGDQSNDWVVRATRPLMALISTCAGSYYVITNPTPDLTIATILFALGATYMGLRHREKGQGTAS